MLTVGTPAAPVPQGGLSVDGGGKNGDPDYFIGSFTLTSVAPSLALGAVGAPAPSGDVDAAYGVDDQQGSTLPTWSAVAPTLATQAVNAPAGKGQTEDPQSWSSATPTLVAGTPPAVPAHDDISEMYGWVEGQIGQLVWAQVAPTLGLGAVAPPTGKGGIPDPFAWQDATFFLTSQLYPLTYTESFAEAGTAQSGTLNVGLYKMQPEAFNLSPTVASGNFYTGMVPYTNWPAEAWNASGTLKSGILDITTGYVNYANWPAEAWHETGTVSSGSLILGLIQYTNWPAEPWNETATLSSGTLT